MTEQFKVGQWVIRRSFGFVGWIVAIRENSGIVVQYPDQPFPITVQPRNLEVYEDVLPEVREEAKRIFVEMALMTRDEEWFMEITS